MTDLICAVIVTYNRAELLTRSLRNTLSQGLDYVIVVDNASSDSTSDVMAKFVEEDSRVRYLPLPRNLGGAYGFSIGLKAADDLLGGCGWALLYDDDSYPTHNCISGFRLSCEDYISQNITGVATLVLSPEGLPVEVNRPILNLFRNPLRVLSLTLPSARSIRDLYHVPYRLLNPESNPLAVDAASFVGLFLYLQRLPAVQKLRYPDSRLFIYSDDTSYTLNLSRATHRLLLDPSLVFVHETFTKPPGQLWITPIWKHYYILRNSFIVNRSLSGLFFVPLCMLTILRHLVSAMAHALYRRNLSLLRIVIVGIADGARSRFSRSHEHVVTLASTSWHR